MTADFHPDSKIVLKAIWVQVAPEGNVIAVAGEYDVVAPSGSAFRKQQSWNDPPMRAMEDAARLVADFTDFAHEVEGVNHEQ